MNENESSTTNLAKPSPEAFLAFDRADDEAILARMRGEALREMVYDFPDGRGGHTYGLSVAGADECKRELAKIGEVIREEEARIESENPDEARFVAKATRYAVFFDGRPEIKLDNALEFKRQEKYVTLRSGKQAPNEHWYETGGSKAVRNAVLKLVPQTIKQRVIEMYKSTAKNVAPSSDQVDADVNRYHNTMDEKDARDKKITDLRDAWVSKGYVISDVKLILRNKGLSESLAARMRDSSAWQTVDESVIDDLLAEAKR